jgi:hypothetical protein
MDRGFIDYHPAQPPAEDARFRQVECDHQWSDGRYCNTTVQYYALCGEPDGRLTLAGFCSLEHVNASSRPTLAAAQRMQAQMAEDGGCSCGHCDAEFNFMLTEKLVAAYPNPIPVTDIENLTPPRAQSGPPQEWTRLFRLLSTMRAEYPYATCTQAPDHDTHLIVGHLDLGLWVLILALGLAPSPDGRQFTCIAPESEQQAQARALYAEVAIRLYGALRALRGEIEPEVAPQAQEEIDELLPQAEALYEEHAVVNQGQPITNDREKVPPFWREMGYESFDAWLAWHREAVGDD